MRTVCKKNVCNGCMGCIEKCPKKCINVKDEIKFFNAYVDEKECINCGLCSRVCPNVNNVQKKRPLAWYQGWIESKERDISSSGGAAYELMKTFIDLNGYVVSCLFEQGKFIFCITNKKEDLNKFRGSKYVKSNPQIVYKKIMTLLQNDEKVLFIGLPCQVAALNNYLGKDVQNLYTVDLICHGTPSSKVLNIFLNEYGIDIEKINEISFRKKNDFRITINGENLTEKKVRDFYTYSFLTCLIYTENCYFCKYASIERVSDITIGDSWGSSLPNIEQEKGISLILCQSKKGKELLKKTKLLLLDVDIEVAVESNHQLRQPSKMPTKRDVFFDNLEKGFNKAFLRSEPKFYYKQKIKEILYKNRKHTSF